MVTLSKHFRSAEFACKDACGLLVIDPQLVICLERLREAIKRPIPIVSGYRCCAHNAKVNGASRSRHTTGEAADIPTSVYVSVREAKAAGFTGIGYDAKTGIVRHVDVRTAGAPVVWQY